MVLCYHRKIKQLILGRYCRYRRFTKMLDVGDIRGFIQKSITLISCAAIRNKKRVDFCINPRFLLHSLTEQ